MDLESLNLRDKRNRFQVNRVDSVATGNHTPRKADHNATLVGYKEYHAASSNNGGTGTTGNGNFNEDSADVPSSYAANMEHITQHNSFHGTIGNQHNTNPYDTKYAKSFRHFTREALPRLDNYRNMMSIQAAYRPTLDELHDITLHQEKPSGGTPAGGTGGAAAKEDGAVKFGWIKGVFVRCLLNIWGVMLFLRLSWVVGQAGIVEACIIIMLATSVTVTTGISMSAIGTNGQIKGAQALLIILSTTVVTLISSISMSAIATNGQIKGGGTYYMISRSLGPEFGASIGLIFALANAIAVAMYTVGFSESMVDLLKSYGTYVVEDPTNSVRIIGAIAIVFQTGIVCIGMSWESKAQVVLLFILLAAMVDFVIGSFIGPLSDEEKSKGFVGFDAAVFVENIGSAYRFSEGTQQSFFSVFSIFFPAATGILAGANISGDLKDPQFSIPRGTLLAILVTTVSYLVFALIVGATVVRDATGPLNFTDSGNIVLDAFTDCYSFNSTTEKTDFTCTEWGLMNSFQVMELVSAWGLLIYLGCFAATLSSALASFVSAPKVFQALCNDNIFPYLEVFGKGYGKSNEPVRGYVLTFIIALIFIVIGELNAIAPLISNFFLAAYALINFSTFHASLASPGFRPSFRYYNMWLSLLGAILCVAVMFLISWVTALLTFGVILFLYMVVVYRKPDSNWGSSLQANTYKNALNSVQQLTLIDEHVKNYRPQILVLSALPSTRPCLVDFAYLITKHLSLLVCGHVVKSTISNRLRVGLRQKSQAWFQIRKIKAFYCSVDDCDFEEGAKSLIQAYGVGKLRPNILMMGFKQNWATCERSELLEYFNVIHKALDMHLSVTVLRVEGGFDFSKKLIFGDEQQISSSPSQGEPGKSKASSDEYLARNNSNQSFSQISHASSGELNPSMSPAVSHSKTNLTPVAESTAMYRSVDGNEVPKDVMENLTRFQKKTKHGTIDVWWLYDDGGLTLLLPYIINTRSNWSSCKLRVFALANKKDEFDAEQRSMAGLLAKFRIDYSDLILIPDVNKKPQPTTSAYFESQIAEFRQELSEEADKTGVVITDAELLAMKDKSNRHMRLRELLLEHSKNSSLVVMTLPMPRKGVVSAPLYMAWLELLTKDMPPFLLVRGNQTSVLTFYS